jgi:cobalt/nickel transport system ATP-binding protein
MNVTVEPDRPMGENLPAGVRISDLTFYYESGHDVLREVTLDIEPGERFGIIGPSGAGKSTLLLHLNGILIPRAGSVKIGDVLVGKNTIADVRRRVGLVFQNPDDQLFNPTVGEDVAFGPINLGLDRGEVAQRVSGTLTAMNLAGFEQKSSHHISYGERKRAALATVLAMQPEVVAFDEPFSNLNPAMVEQLIETIRNLPATVIVVSQSILPVVASCDRIAVLNEGEIVRVGPTGEVMADHELLERCGLDVRFYCELCHNLMNAPSPEPGADNV